MGDAHDSTGAPSHGGTCPYCKEAIHPEAVICKECLSDLREGTSGCRDCSPVASALSSTGSLSRDSGEAAKAAFVAGAAARGGGWRIPIGPIVIGPNWTGLHLHR